MYRIQVFEIRPETDVARYLPAYPAVTRTRTTYCDDCAHFQETTEGLSVPRPMWRRTEGTFTTTRRCCGVFVILAPDIKLQTYLLIYLLRRLLHYSAVCMLMMCMMLCNWHINCSVLTSVICLICVAVTHCNAEYMLV